MLVLESSETYTYIIKKSKFIGMMFAVFTKQESEQIIEDVKKQYKDARHVCYAYVLSHPPVEKCHDDGEPKGTAGLPILNVLKKQRLQNILVVVVRYFGGIKLGAGGLIKAYMDTCIGLIKKADFVDYNKYFIYQVKTKLNTMQAVENHLNTSNITVLNTDFNKVPGEVIYNIASASKLSDDAINYINTLKGEVVFLKTKFLSEKVTSK